MSAKIYRSGDGFLRIHWGFIPFHFVSGEVRVNATRLAFLFPSTLKGKSGVAGRRRFPTLSSVKKPAKIRKSPLGCILCVLLHLSDSDREVSHSNRKVQRTVIASSAWRMCIRDREKNIRFWGGHLFRERGSKCGF